VQANEEEDGRRADIHGRGGGTDLRSTRPTATAQRRHGEADPWKRKENERGKEAEELKAQVDRCGEAAASASAEAAARRVETRASQAGRRRRRG